MDYGSGNTWCSYHDQSLILPILLEGLLTINNFSNTTLLTEPFTDILKSSILEADYPFVSVIIAARNEESNVEECLTSLANQSYPGSRYEVWVGDDGSEDSTNSIVRSFIQSHPGFHVLEITDRWKHLKGKTNVLAQLIRKANGQIILVTDADIIANQDWITSLVKHFNESLSMITGVTVVGGNSLWAKLQRAEWIFYVGNGHLQSEKGKPVTAIGNNMGFTKEAYESIGGYENIPFSITEDLELYKQITTKGGTFKTLFQPDAIVFTKPITSIKTLFHQRKRWISGVFQLPVPIMLGLLFIWNLLIIFILAGLLFGWKVFASILIIKWIADIFFLKFLYKKLNLQIDIGTFFYTPYSLLLNVLFLCFYFSPTKVNWKGRKY